MKVAFDGTPAAQAYTRAFRRLWDLPGFDPKAALLAEAGVILKTWAGRTKVAKADEVSVRARLRVLRRLGYTRGGESAGNVTINAGLRGPLGRVWHQGRSRATGDRTFRLAGLMARDGRFTANRYHFRDRDWRDIQDAVLDAEAGINIGMKNAERSAGLARQSVIQIADDLGIDLAKVKGGGGLSTAGIAKARAAIASSGKSYKNGAGATGGDKAKTFVDLVNRLPYGTAAGLDRTLAGVLAGRAKFIETAYAKGAFDSIASAAKAFPELFRMQGFSAPASAA